MMSDFGRVVGISNMMKPEHELLGAGMLTVAEAEPQYATRGEVEAALDALSDADYSKLMMIAASYCRQRRLTFNACESKELLNQAVLKTLECEEGKRWNKKVSMVRHLDRAMENISGHLVRERMKIVAFPDGLRPENYDLQASPEPEDEDGKERVASLLKSIFGTDDLARRVFVMRAEDFGPDEIQSRLAITPQEYETTNRRILRKISQFLTKKEK
jgi:DNA-directed RNA polymerase specialized sigma24 family protein